MKVLDMAESGSATDAGRCVEADVVAGRFESLLADMAALGDHRFVELSSRLGQRLERARLLAVARLAGCSGDVRSDRRRARVHLPRGGQSGRSMNRDARRAAALAANEALADQVSGGGLTGDGIDALCRAADEVSGAIPIELVEDTAGLEPDQLSGFVDRYLEERASAQDANRKYEAQMRARRVRRYSVPAAAGDPALSGLGIEGPDAVIDQIWALVNSGADSSYQSAGGRETAGRDHQSLDHRRFDVAERLLQGRSDAGAGRGGRPTVVVTIGIDRLVGARGRPKAGRGAEPGAGIQLGCGPIGDDLVARYAGEGDLAAVITGLDGQPLWLGRARRQASAAQFLALIVRDRGCVLCRAPFQRCEAHHIIPWHAPAKGGTDLENLALLCGACHRQLHADSQTLVRERSPTGASVWRCRPATAAEIPPPRPIQTE